MTKMTKRDYFNTLLSLSEVQADETLVSFINHELELLSKKNSSEKKDTPTQVANKATKDAIYSAMESGKRYFVSELIKEIPALYDASTPKASALVNQMVAEGRVLKEVEKGRSYFSKVEGV